MLPTADQSPTVWTAVVTPEAMGVERIRRDASAIAGTLSDRAMTPGELYDRVGVDAERAKLALLYLLGGDRVRFDEAEQRWSLWLGQADASTAEPDALAMLRGRIKSAIRSGDIEDSERWTGIAERLLRRDDGLCLAEDIGLV